MQTKREWMWYASLALPVITTLDRFSSNQVLNLRFKHVVCSCERLYVQCYANTPSIYNYACSVWYIFLLLPLLYFWHKIASHICISVVTVTASSVGVYNETIFEAIDYVLAQAAQHNHKAIIALSSCVPLSLMNSNIYLFSLVNLRFFSWRMSAHQINITADFWGCEIAHAPLICRFWNDMGDGSKAVCSQRSSIVTMLTYLTHCAQLHHWL